MCQFYLSFHLLNCPNCYSFRIISLATKIKIISSHCMVGARRSLHLKVYRPIISLVSFLVKKMETSIKKIEITNVADQ